MNATEAESVQNASKALPIIADKVPRQLKRHKQWVLWRTESRDGKPTKVPYQINCQRADSTNPKTWTSFDRAMNAYRAGGFDGIGFVVTPETGLIGIDLDHCAHRESSDTQLEVEDWAVEIFQQMCSYSELSPSGTGIRIFVQGKLPDGVKGRKKGNVEVYSSDRYLTVTGHAFPSTSQIVEPRQKEIDWLFSKYFTEEKQEKASSNGNGAWHASDDELLAKAFAARNGDKLKRLFEGDISEYPSQSEADLALCSLLAFWASDEAQLDRLFRRSALMRDKWDERHGAGTYAQRTIDRAWSNQTEHYTEPSRHDNNTRHKTDEPLQDNDLSVLCLEDADSQDSKLDNCFPEAAWTGLFARWRDTVAPCTEASLEILWGAFLLAAGLVIGRNAWRESPRPLYPNFYLLLLGQTGDSRKSTVLWLVSELLRHAGEQFKALDGVVSSEGIYEALADHEGAKAIISADEFRALLSVARRKGTQDIIPRLNSLYYCPEHASIDRVKDSTEIVRPFVSLIAATPQAYIEDILSDLEISGGFLNRFLIISGEEQEPKAIVRSPSATAWGAIAGPLRALREIQPGHLEFSQEATELWKEFYTNWKTERRNLQPKQANLSARTFEHVLKIAVVYSTLAKKEREISARSLAVAVAIGGWLQSNTLRLFADAGLDQLGKCERTIIDLLKRARDCRMWRRDLQRELSGRGVNGEVFNRAIKALESNDHITCYMVTAPSGRRRPIVEYIPRHKTDNSAKNNGV